MRGTWFLLSGAIAETLIYGILARLAAINLGEIRILGQGKRLGQGNCRAMVRTEPSIEDYLPLPSKVDFLLTVLLSIYHVLFHGPYKVNGKKHSTSEEG